MDIAIHWGVYRRLRHDIEANGAILITAICLDVIVLGAFIWIKIQQDMLVIWASLIGLAIIFIGERLFIGNHRQQQET